jgi:Tfp pilus assembly protein PilN
MIEINLLPGAGRRSRGGGLQTSDLLSSAGAWISDKYLMGAVGAVVVAIGLTAFLYVHQTRAASDLNERQIKAVEDSTRYSAVLAAKAKAEATRDSAMQQLAIIKSIDDTRFLWSHLMQEISAALPQYTWLTAITQTSIPPSAAAVDTTQRATPSEGGGEAGSKARAARAKEKRDRADSLLVASQSVKFRIIGNTVDIQALTQFMKALEASPFIQNVQLTRSDLVVNEGKEVTEFQLEAESQRPSPYLIKTVPLMIPGG